jgi:hypothetical protein
MKSTALEPRCPGCGNFVDEEDLFCGNCGRAVDTAGAVQNEIEQGFTGFDCRNCGASMTFDIEQQGLRCAFCGSVSLQKQNRPTGRIRPEYYLPFEISQEGAAGHFREWIGRGFFRPFGIEKQASVVETGAAYLPFWVFEARARSYYTGDSSQTPPFARASWCPVFGEREDDIRDILVPASGSLGVEEVNAISPYDFGRRKVYEREDLQDVLVEDFGVSRRGARTVARALMAERVRALAAAMIPGNHRNVRVNPIFMDLRAAPALLPVWINAYQFRGKTFRFLVNGQTGEVVGSAPFSYVKLVLVIIAALVVLFLILLAASQASGVGS